jgi:hypothetical protein
MSFNSIGYAEISRTKNNTPIDAVRINAATPDIAEPEDELVNGFISSGEVNEFYTKYLSQNTQRKYQASNLSVGNENITQKYQSERSKSKRRKDCDVMPVYELRR